MKESGMAYPRLSAPVGRASAIGPHVRIPRSSRNMQYLMRSVLRWKICWGSFHRTYGEGLRSEHGPGPSHGWLKLLQTTFTLTARVLIHAKQSCSQNGARNGTFPVTEMSRQTASHAFLQSERHHTQSRLCVQGYHRVSVQPLIQRSSPAQCVISS